MTKIKISFEVPTDQVGGILAQVADKVSNLTINVVESVSFDKNKPKAITPLMPRLGSNSKYIHRTSRRNGPNSVTTGGKSQMTLILEALSNAPMGMAPHQLGDVMDKSGFSRSSVSARLVDFMTKRLIERPSPGIYKLSNHGRDVLTIKIAEWKARNEISGTQNSGQQPTA